jgi:hypothetical protein
MDTNQRSTPDDRFASEAAKGDGKNDDKGDHKHVSRRLLRDSVRTVSGRIGDIRRHGIRPLLDEAAAQVRPASREELLARFPDLNDDQIARKLTDRAARTAAGVALAVGGVIVAQEAAAAASAAAPPAAGGILGTIGITALSEVLALFMVEAKLRTDLNALAGQPTATPRDLVAAVLGEVAAVGGWSKLRGRSLRRVLPEAAARRAAASLARMVPRRFARIIIPEVIAPAIGSVIAARIASKQVRDAGREHWTELRGPDPSTEVRWGEPDHNGHSRGV